jgi:hypothetical protein
MFKINNKIVSQYKFQCNIFWKDIANSKNGELEKVIDLNSVKENA